MNRFRTYTFFLSLVVIFISGCAQRQAPDPSMTAIGHGGSRGGSADWINSEDISRAQDLGLGMRDDRFSVGEDGGIRDMFPPVLFDFDQSFVRPSDRPALQEAANYLAENRNVRMVLEGHCDWRGTTEYNMALGDRRASAVKNYLVSLGVPENRLETISKGDLEANVGGNESQMQMDRRVDLIVIP
jgi:peptidoglycan-associated lipoprotein